MNDPSLTPLAGHPPWVRLCHWLVALSFLILTYSGVVILMCHPRLYWGEVGNDLTPALVELPIGPNAIPLQWENRTPFTGDDTGPVSATRMTPIVNMNDTARSLHFLAAWAMVVPGAAYLIGGFSTGHFRRHLWPRPGELSLRSLWSDATGHLRRRFQPAGGSRYGLLQKCTYFGVVFVAVPLIVLSGLAMSPAITAGYPLLGRVFGGFQSARTIHFILTVALVLFLLVHVTMVVRTGFRRQMRGMTLGSKP